MAFDLTLPIEISGRLRVLETDEEGNVAVSGTPVFEIPQGCVGADLVATLVDRTGTGVDVSTATAILFYAKDADENQITNGAAGAFYTDGTDFKVKFTLTSTEVATVRDLHVDFEVQGMASGTKVTRLAILRILPRAKVV